MNPPPPHVAEWRQNPRLRFLIPHRLLTVLLLFTTAAVFAQRRWRGGRTSTVHEGVRTAREVESHSTGTPTWTNVTGFDHDVFTFTRVRYEHNGRYGRGGWTTDVPDSDLNLSFRLQQMTSMRVDPNGRLLQLTDPELPPTIRSSTSSNPVPSASTTTKPSPCASTF